MTPTDFDIPALIAVLRKIRACESEVAAQFVLEKYAHAIRDLVLQGSGEPVAWLVPCISDSFAVPGYETGQTGDYGAFPVFTRPQLPPEQQEELERLRKEVKHDRNMDGVKDFIDAMIMGQSVWPNPWGQDVAFAAYSVYCLKLEIELLKAKLTELPPALPPTPVECLTDRLQRAEKELTQLRAENAALRVRNEELVLAHQLTQPLKAELSSLKESMAGKVLVDAEVISFLLGSGPLEGVWFGERHPMHKGQYWWRKYFHIAATEKEGQ